MTAPAHRLQHGAYLLLKGLVRALPHAAARPLGAGLGTLAWRVSARRRRLALSNLGQAFPEMSPPELRRTIRACFQHFGALLGDILSVGRFDGVELCRRVRLEGWERLAEAEAKGRGLILLAAHFGSFELLAHYVALFHGGMHVVMRPTDNPLLDRELIQGRERFGNITLSKRFVARKMARVLRDRGRTVILIDHRVPRRQGIDVPFFGRPAITSTLPARLSLLSGAPAVPIFAYPRPAGFRVVVRAPIEPEGSGPQAVAALTHRYSEAVEREVRTAPHLWWWMHDRWKIQ